MSNSQDNITDFN